MGRVAVDFGVCQGAKRSADIRSDLGPASNAGQRQNQRNRCRREAEGQLGASLGRYSPLWGCASLAPCHPPFCLYARPTPVFQQSLRARQENLYQSRSRKSAAQSLFEFRLGLALCISRLALAFAIPLAYDRRTTGRTVLSGYRKHRVSEAERSTAFAP